MLKKKGLKTNNLKQHWEVHTNTSPTQGLGLTVTFAPNPCKARPPEALPPLASHRSRRSGISPTSSRTGSATSWMDSMSTSLPPSATCHHRATWPPSFSQVTPVVLIVSHEVIHTAGACLCVCWLVLAIDFVHAYVPRFDALLDPESLHVQNVSHRQLLSARECVFLLLRPDTKQETTFRVGATW